MNNTNNVKEELKFRYRVGCSKPVRCFWSVLFIVAISVFIYAVVLLEKEQRLGESILWLIGIGVYLVYGLASFHFHVDVYKGRIVYDRLIWKKEYPLSEFGEPKEDAEPLVILHHSTQWSTIYVFYDRNGKKMFKVYDQWTNAEKLYKEIKQRYRQVWQNNHNKEKNHGNQKHQRNGRGRIKQEM